MLAQLVKQPARSDLPRLAQEAGFRLARGRTYHCALHRDRTPSAHLYDDAMYCFSCGQNYDAIELARLTIGGSVAEAICWLAERYGIAYEFTADLGQPRFCDLDLTYAELFRTGYCWVLEAHLEDLKRPLSDGGFFNGRQIRKATSRLLRVKAWNSDDTATFFQRLLRWRPEFVRCCIDEVEEFQIEIATILAQVNSKEVQAA